MAVVPEGAQRSGDGHYWWDGTAWQEVPADERTGSSASASSATGSQDPAGAHDAGGLSHEQLAQITSEEQLDERSHPYFQPNPDTYPDDSSQAEGGDLLSDEAAPDAGGVA